MALLAAARAGRVAEVDNLLNSSELDAVEEAARAALAARQWGALELLAGHLAAAGTEGNAAEGAKTGGERLSDLLGPAAVPTLGEVLGGAPLSGLEQLRREPGPVVVAGESGTPFSELSAVLDRSALGGDVLAALGARQKAFEDWADAAAVDGLAPAGAREVGGQLLPAYVLRVRHAPE